jgi:type VI secretion system ImpM family protein
MTAPGLFGKLPSKGDFVTRGLAPGFLAGFETWLAGIVDGARQSLGDGWAEIYDTAPLWRFWIGPKSGAPACVGVLAASRDRVGRRFPLVILAEAGPDGSGLPRPPIAGAPQDWFETVEAALAEAMAEGFDDDPGVVLTRLVAPGGGFDGAAAPGQAFWAVGPAPQALRDRAAASVAPEPEPELEPQPERAVPAATHWAVAEDAPGDDASPFDASPFDDAGNLAPVVAGVADDLDASPFDDPFGADPAPSRAAPLVLRAALVEEDVLLADAPELEPEPDEVTGQAATEAEAEPEIEPEVEPQAEPEQPDETEAANATEPDLPVEPDLVAEQAPPAAAPRDAAAELAELLMGAAHTEVALQAAQRSYWWTGGDATTPAAFIALTGLPDGAAFAAMLGGFRSAALANVGE